VGKFVALTGKGKCGLVGIEFRLHKNVVLQNKSSCKALKKGICGEHEPGLTFCASGKDLR